jgi:DNA repair exonuclease SbcCD nuclease subunit
VEESGALRSQSELFAEALSRVRPRLDPADLNLLVAHCFATGGSPSESERSFVGAAEEVPIELFEAFDYVALGHLHRAQAAGPKARYPGSPLAYSFAEAEASPEKGFLLVELGKGGFSERLIPVEPLHRVVRINGSYEELSRPGAFPEFRGAFVEARLTDALPVLDPVDALRANFPNLLSVRQAAFELPLAAPGGAQAGEGPAPGTAPGLAPRGEEAGEGLVLEDFRVFHGAIYGKEAEPELESLFLELLKEAAHASA